MISNPREHQWGVALVTRRNQTAEAQRVAFSEAGEDAELPRASWSTPSSARTATGEISCGAGESDLLRQRLGGMEHTCWCNSLV